MIFKTMRSWLFFIGKKIPVGLLLLICLFSVQKMKAAEEKYTTKENGTAIQVGAMLTTQDDKFVYMLQNPSGSGAWNTLFDIRNLDNLITLSMDPYNRAVLSGDFDITVKMLVSYDLWDYGAGVFKNKILPDTVSLKVSSKNLDSKVPQTYKSVYRFPGGNRLRVTVVKVTSSVSPIPVALTLESEISVERYYRMNTSSMITTLEHKSTFISSRGELELSWDYLPGAEEYEIEWTHLDNYRTEQNIAASTPTAEKDALQILFVNVDFKTNATRVNTTSNFYRIPLMYERGYILYRVRAAGKDRSTSFTRNYYTRWSDEAITYKNVNEFPNKYKITETDQLNANLNWQSSVSFAEEGKNKASVSYFDGSLRNRQTVTKMNTKDEVIAGETIYDAQGRPMIQVLPAPISSARPNYKPGLNTNTAGAIYSEKDVTKDVNSGCYGPAAPMDSSTGASMYYSPSNPDKSNENKYIPDAKEYPFTQTVYTPDNTGRITSQSGVGETHRIGNGKETKYYYNGAPNSSDVNRLFGNEVGGVARYKKNLVVDANGQVSISYLDAQGRVIATALAGASPAEVDELESSGIVNKTMNMFESRNNETDKRNGATKTFTNTFGVTTRDEWKFDYNIQAKKFTELCADLELGEITKCYDCILDLQLLLEDQCGQQYMVNLPNFDPDNNTIQVGELIAGSLNSGNCDSLGDPVFFNDYTTSQLPVGSYTITRVLSVNEQALDLYMKDYLATSDCIIDLQEFINEETELNVTGRCNGGCTECLEELGSYDQYNFALNPNCIVCMTPEEYEQRLQTCKDICDPVAIDCEMLESSMLADLTLFGQYAGITLEIEDDTTTTTNEAQKFYVYNSTEADIFPLSIFNEGNKLPRKKWFVGAGPGGSNLSPNWRHPYRKKADGTIVNYYEDENERRAYVKINKAGSGFLPDVVDRSKVYSIYDPKGAVIGYSTDPENLKEVAFFIANWDETWANALLIYHPEYCYLEYCQANSNSYDFDDRWFSAETVAAAPVGFTDPIGILKDNIASLTSWDNAFQDDDANTRLDPFMNPSINGSYNLNDFNSIKNRMMKAVPKHVGVTSNSDASEFYNIWQAAYISVFCPDYEDAPGTNTSCDRSSCAASFNDPSVVLYTLTHNDKVWETFRAYYYSAKREIVENRAIQFAIKRGCYNGCMATKSFDVNADGFLAALYKETKMETYSVPYNEYYWPQYVRFAQRSTLMYAFLKSINFFRERAPVTYTKQVEYFQSQYYNPEQPCNSENYRLYADADKVYNRNKDGLTSMGAASPNTCTATPISNSVYAVDPTELEAVTGPVCPEANEELKETAMNKAAFELYQQCGQCTTTKILETFFDEVASTSEINNTGLASTNLQVNCYPDGLASFTKDLEEKFQYTKGLGGQRQVGDIIWIASSPDPNTLTVNLTKTVGGVPQTAQLVLVKKPSYDFKDLNTGLVHSFEFSWDDIFGICCFEATDVLSILSPGVGVNGYKFKGRARVEISFDGDTNVLSERINIEGYTNKINLTCDPPVLCETLPIAIELSNLWNVIAYSSPTFQGVDGNGNFDVVVYPVNSKFTSPNFLIDADISTYSKGNLPYESSVSMSLLSSLPAISGLPVLPPNAPAPVISAWWKMTDAAVASNKKTFLLVLLNSDGSTLGQYPFEFEIESSDYSIGLDFNAIKRFVQVTADKNSSDPSRYFTAKALVSGPYGMQYIKLKGYSPSIQIGQCKTAIKAIGAFGSVNGQ